MLFIEGIEKENRGKTINPNVENKHKFFLFCCMILLFLSLEVDTATLSSGLAWRILWTEEPGGLWSIGSQRVGHD